MECPAGGVRHVHGLVLVECQPYGARLQLSSCVSRWRAMRDSGDMPPSGTAGVKHRARRNALALCDGCEYGRVRSEAQGDGAAEVSDGRR